MKKIRTIILLCAAMLYSMALTASASDSIPEPEFVRTVETISVSPEEFGLECEMDYSLLDGVLTVELTYVPDGTELLVGEYAQDGTLLKTHFTDDVQTSNTFEVSGEYERAYLWYTADQTPAADSISTKCDYEIVEGTEGEWEVSDDGHTLYSYLGTDTDVVIPNSYRGKRIKIIENDPAINNGGYYSLEEFNNYNIFGGRTDITSVKISDGIIAVGSYAFAGCSKLSGDLYLPKTVRLVYYYSFLNCSKLTGSLDLSAVKILGSFAFYGCSGLNGTLTLPSISEIPRYAFAGCSGFTGALEIPEGVETLGTCAFCIFSGSGSFTSLSLPSTLKSIGFGQFQNQQKIAGEISLPDSLEHIGDFAFDHCKKISNTTLKIPSGLKTIGGDYNVSSNTGYGGHVFYDSFKSLTEYEADGDNFVSKDGVLYSKDMTRLVAYPPAKTGTAFEMPEGVTAVDEMAFGYSKITDITLSDSFVMSETVPSNIINNMANNLAVSFYHYNKIKNVWVKDSNTSYTSLNGVLYSKDMTELWYVPTNNAYTINVNDGTTAINKGAFYIEYESGEIFNAVSIPASVADIDSENLTSLNFRAAKGTMTITVDSENPYYEVTDGILAKKQ